MRKIFKRFFILIIVIICLTVSSCQTNNTTSSTSSTENSYLVNEGNLSSVIETLADEQYQGRLTGSVGNQQAMEYIKNKYMEYGLLKIEDNYYQEYSQNVVKVNSVPKLEIYSGDTLVKEYRYIYDFGLTTYLHNSNMSDTIHSEAYFVDSYGSYGEEIRDKIILASWNSYVEYNSQITNLRGGLIGAKGLIIEDERVTQPTHPYDYFPVVPNTNDTTSDKENGFITYRVSPQVFSEIKDFSNLGYTIKMVIDSELQTVNTANVIGYIEGNTKKDEYIIISAHLDHVGANGTESYNPGGFDNASGIAAILEIARILSLNKEKLDKTIVFIAFNGEEEGLHGSTYYSNDPLFDLSKTEVINLDMVGSLKDIPVILSMCHISGYTLSNDFIEVNKGSTLAFTRLDQRNSDHAPFCDKGVPSVSLVQKDFNGYHTPQDTALNVDVSKLADITSTVLNYIYNGN